MEQDFFVHKRNYLSNFECPKVDWEKLQRAYGGYIPLKTASKILGVNETYIKYLRESQDLDYSAVIDCETGEWVYKEGTSVDLVKELFEDGFEFCNHCGRMFPFRTKYFRPSSNGKPSHTCRECYNKQKRMSYKENPFNNKETLVYFISNGSYVKIGITSRKIDERLKEFRTGSTHKFEVIKTEKYPSRILASQRESELHRYYKDKHVNGEWYDILDEVG